MAFFINAGRRIVYLSRIVRVGDSDTNGEPNRAAIQAALDEAQAAAAPITLVHDVEGVINCDGLLLPAYDCQIETLARGKWKKKGNDGVTPGSGSPLFRNRTITPYGSGTPNGRYRIRGGYFDDNRRGLGSGGTHAYWQGRGFPSFVYVANNQDVAVPCMGFYGVADLHIEDVHFYDQITMGVQLGNVNHVRITHLRGTRVPGDPEVFDNKVQGEGGCFDVIIDDIQGDVQDDLVAFNCSDVQDLYPTNWKLTFYPGVVSGPSADIVLRNATIITASQFASVLRMLVAGGHTMKRVTVENVSALQTPTNGVFFNSFNIPGGATYEDITVTNCKGIVPKNGWVSFTNPPATVRGVVLDNLGGDGGGVNSLVQIPTIAQVDNNGGGASVTDLTMTRMVGRNCPFDLDIRTGSIATLRSNIAAGRINDPGARIASKVGV